MHYRNREIDENHALKLAKFFVHFEYYAPAMEILNKYLSSTKNEEIIAYIFKLNNYNNIELNNNQFAESCIKIREKLSKKNWYNMFIGSCNISPQVFNHKGFINFIKLCTRSPGSPAILRPGLHSTPGEPKTPLQEFYKVL